MKLKPWKGLQACNRRLLDACHLRLGTRGKRKASLGSRFRSANAQEAEMVFSEIYSELHRPILSFFLKKTHDAHCSEELAQEVFLKVFRARETYDPQYEISSWVWTIARNTLNDHFRQKLAQPAAATTNEAPGEGAFVEQIPCPRKNAEELIDHKTERLRFMKFLESLPHSQKTALVLRLVHHLSYQEISQRMNLSLSAVKSLLNRSTSALRRMADTPSLAHHLDIDPMGSMRRPVI